MPTFPISEGTKTIEKPLVKGTRSIAVFGVTTTEPICRMSRQTTSITMETISYYPCIMGIFLVINLTCYCHLFVNTD